MTAAAVRRLNVAVRNPVIKLKAGPRSFPNAMARYYNPNPSLLSQRREPPFRNVKF